MASIILSARQSLVSLVRPAVANQIRFHQAAASSNPASSKPDNQKTPLECVSEQKAILIDGRSVYCNGGSDVNGHPRVWINLDKPYTMACGYCGVRYAQKHLVEEHGGELPLYTAV